MLRPDVTPGSDRPPSGLFSAAAFEREVLGRLPRRPAWWADRAERDRRYAEWVQAESAGLVAQLGRLDRPGIDAGLAGHLRGLARALAADAAWAGERLERPRTAA